MEIPGTLSRALSRWGPVSLDTHEEDLYLQPPLKNKLNNDIRLNKQDIYYDALHLFIF